MLERESAPELVCKVLESEIASENGGTEGIDSANEGQSQLLSGLRNIRGNEVTGRSKPLSTHETCWGASRKESDGTDGLRGLSHQRSPSSWLHMASCISGFKTVCRRARVFAS